ncbi:MAG: Phosphoheptose isomerase 1 [Phycisphaerae bacterium]|nr:Phosphoheptose isomerase 1 [Phycisphaerae bacterium]
MDAMDAQITDHIRGAEALRGQSALLEAVVAALIRCFQSGGRLYVLGNGGSAADAQHIAAELVGRFKRDRRPLPAIALTTDTSVLTAVGNDLGAEEVFRRQVEALVRAEDVVWALSVSGTSPNVIAALAAARQAGATCIGFTGRGGGRFPEYCALCLRADHAASDRVQEIHQLAYHLVCNAVETHFAG